MVSVEVILFEPDRKDIFRPKSIRGKMAVADISAIVGITFMVIGGFLVAVGLLLCYVTKVRKGVFPEYRRQKNTNQKDLRLDWLCE